MDCAFIVAKVKSKSVQSVGLGKANCGQESVLEIIKKINKESKENKEIDKAICLCLSQTRPKLEPRTQSGNGLCFNCGQRPKQKCPKRRARQGKLWTRKCFRYIKEDETRKVRKIKK